MKIDDDTIAECDKQIAILNKNIARLDKIQGVLLWTTVAIILAAGAYEWIF